MLHEDEQFPEAGDFKGLVKSRVVCHAGILWGEAGVGGLLEWRDARKQRGWWLVRWEGEARQAPEIR